MSEQSAVRAPIHADINEALIATLVEAFYARVRADAVLGPIFDRVIEDRWDQHLQKLRDFWSSVTMMSGRYKGTPFQAHQRIEGLSAEHFERWLNLWRETAESLCGPEVARLLVERAERIAASLQHGLLKVGNARQHDAAGGSP